MALARASAVCALLLLIGAVPASAAINEFPLPTAASEPQGITAGPDGNLWVAERHASRITRITPAGAVTEFTLAAGREPVDIAAAGGFVWFTERAGVRIGRLDPNAANIQASIIEFAVPGGTSEPTGIAAGPDGNAWFTETGSDEIGRITPGLALTEFGIPGAGSKPTGIAAGPDGAMWFTEPGSGQIGRITTAGAVTNEFAVPALEGQATNPAAITAGPDGALWFADQGLDQVRRITTAGVISSFPLPAGSGIGGITAGPDGNLWATEGRAGKIARVTPAGSISEFTLPTAGAGPADIAAGPGGALWFSERLSSGVGRITTDTAPDALPTGPPGQNGAPGAPGQNGAPGAPGKLVVVAFQVAPSKPRAGRRLKVRFAITGAAATTLQIKRGRARARTVARKTLRKAGVSSLTWNGKIGRKRAPRGTYTLTVGATSGGQTATSRLKVKLR